MSRASYILIPISNPKIEFNFSQTVKFSSNDSGYWSSPGTGGENSQIGDQIWFYRGKNFQESDENCLICIGSVTSIIDPILQPDLHSSMRSVWEGEWSDRKILVFKFLPLLPKDKLSYDQLLEYFSKGKRMANGSYRVKID